MQKNPLQAFLEDVPPGKAVAAELPRYPAVLGSPDIQLHCGGTECGGVRFFTGDESVQLKPNIINTFFWIYTCKNCARSVKTYALRFTFMNPLWEIFKYGETPSFGPPTPARAITLIGGERELFLLGRQCENQGMGIGAFVYYRRVLESQKNRIFDELIRVITKVSPDEISLVEDLENAKEETQFTTAVEKIKNALPGSLLINGYNPLTLLHHALSEGVHVLTDAECLELATSIRTVLFEFADKLGQALKEESTLNAAVTRLANKR